MDFCEHLSFAPHSIIAHAETLEQYDYIKSILPSVNSGTDEYYIGLNRCDLGSTSWRLNGDPFLFESVDDCVFDKCIILRKHETDIVDLGLEFDCDLPRPLICQHKCPTKNDCMFLFNFH